MSKIKIMTRLVGKVGSATYHPNLPKLPCSLSPPVLIFAVATVRLDYKVIVSNQTQNFSLHIEGIC